MVHLPVNSFSPPSPDWGQCGCNALRPACPDAPFEAGGAQQHPGNKLAGAEHLKVLLPFSSGLWRAGASAAARLGCVSGLQNTQLAATFSLQGLLVAPSLLNLHASCLSGAAGSRALRTHPPCPERSSRAAAWLCSGCSSPLRLRVPPCAVPQGLYSAFLQLHLIGRHWGSTDLARCTGVRAGVPRRGVALPCCLFLHATCVPSPRRRPRAALGLWASWGPCPWPL